VTTTTPPSKEKAEEFVELEAEIAADEAAGVTSKKKSGSDVTGDDSRPDLPAGAEPTVEQAPLQEVVNVTRGLGGAALAFSFAFPFFRRF
jgi:hypothetical protein